MPLSRERIDKAWELEYPFWMEKMTNFQARPGNRTKAVFLVLGLVPFWASCSSSTGPLLTLWEGNLSPLPPSHLSGQVAAITQFGRTEVSIDIRMAEPGTVYTWRVESGTCQGEGVIQDGPAVYPDLMPGEGGTDSEQVFLSSLFKPGSQLAVKVFDSVGGSGGEMVSCGELVEI